MRLRRLLTDRSAFSSVVGIVLLVAVVIGTVVTVFAFGFAESATDVAPTAGIEFEYNYFGDGVAKNDSVTVIHDGGDTLERTRLEIRVGDDTVYNDTSDSESNSPTNNVRGLIVEVDDDDFNDLNKPGRLSPPGTVGGPPGDGDGSDPGVVLKWEKEVQAGKRVVIQERNDPRSYDVMDADERIVVVWRGQDSSAIIAEDTVAPEQAD
jgi:FlaG/FlaF family flagellin (archaellin)